MRYALLGNPNTGKSSVFNMLTGLRQHVGNFPGVTVDKKKGKISIVGESAELVDFPGTYSIYPRTEDERVVYDHLIGTEERPDAVIVVVDAANLERNLLLFSQVYDLGLPTLMVLNMIDIAERSQQKVDLNAMETLFPEALIVTSNARIKLGKDRIYEALGQLPERREHRFLNNAVCAIDDIACQESETRERLSKINDKIDELLVKNETPKVAEKIDKILVHPIWGYLIFGAVLLLIFQAIYSFAAYPMDWIDEAFVALSGYLSETLPAGIFSDLIAEGIVPGIGGVVVFIPQIALLFFFIGVLEESGYLARVVFIMDRLMRPLGLNGKSVVPLMSSVACAIPGVMAARTIADQKERLTTILVAPLMSCSARIPVYTLLIALVIPDQTVLGILNLKGLVLLGLYVLGTVMALLVALIIQKLLKQSDKGFLLLELPGYKMPKINNLGLLVWEKVRVFVMDAGKVILAISIVLWALASYGPSQEMEQAGKDAVELAKTLELDDEETTQLIASKKLEHSYIGHMGKFIEPAIRPLGYDWKIGVALISSFAAREVFVGSMATIYAVHDDGETNRTLLQKMKSERHDDGSPVYTLASGLSLMVFYAFAMMCMATLAVVKRETKSWKWPLIQVGYMGVLAYFGALVVFHIFN